MILVPGDYQNLLVLKSFSTQNSCRIIPLLFTKICTICTIVVHPILLYKDVDNFDGAEPDEEDGEVSD
jgi:hypothetical protein